MSRNSSRQKLKRRHRRIRHRAQNRERNVELQGEARRLDVFCECGLPASRVFMSKFFRSVSGHPDMKAVCPKHSGSIDRSSWDEVPLSEYVVLVVQTS